MCESVRERERESHMQMKQFLLLAVHKLLTLDEPRSDYHCVCVCTQRCTGELSYGVVKCMQERKQNE